MPGPIDFSYLDHVASPVFVLQMADGGQRRFAAVNLAACQLTGRTRDRFLGKTPLQTFGDTAEHADFVQVCMAVPAGESATYQVNLPTKTGAVPVCATLRAAQGAAGAASLFFFTMTTPILTGPSHAPASSATQTEQFVAMAAHDLRAPMRNVTALADMLRDGFVDYGDGKLELIDMLEGVATKSLHLISDVLLHAQTATLDRSEQAFDFESLCRDIFGSLDPQGKHSICVQKGTLRADKAALQIAITNLIQNALKHGRRPGMTITVTVRSVQADLIEISIIDNGSGFDNPGIVFLDSGKFRTESGYGLLGIQRLIIERGGTIEVSNMDDGIGSIVTFSLPGQWEGSPSRPDHKQRSGAG